ncbi:RNA polymerase sigma factor [Silvibacterium dinghuense]|uniref:RNA polymerase sigma factor n=1 Tax=Silvibacterium dinghuense TaxID=1560006 RepID=UPI0013E972B1|nr:sigma-70 family RNA polymerase sigma factor [Silvibacterium dinghuense]
MAETYSQSAAVPGSGARAIEEEAFAVLYERTARPLWAYLLRISGRREVADDLVQETFCRFLMRRSDGKTMDEAETRRYLFRIATNLMHDLWRQKSRGSHDFEEELEDGDASLDRVAEAGPERELQLDLQRAMAAMKPRERQLLWLAYVEGMDHAEIAAVTGLNRLSVRMLLFRARKRAAEMLEPERRERV